MLLILKSMIEEHHSYLMHHPHETRHQQYRKIDHRRLYLPGKASFNRVSAKFSEKLFILLNCNDFSNKSFLHTTSRVSAVAPPGAILLIPSDISLVIPWFINPSSFRSDLSMYAWVSPFSMPRVEIPSLNSRCTCVYQYIS